LLARKGSAVTNGSNGSGAARSLAPRRQTAIRTLADFTSSLVGRLEWVRQAGLTFGTLRDLYATLGYKRVLTINDYRDRYRRGGIAERIVEAYPLATWAGGARIVEDPNPDLETEFEAATRILFDRLGIWNMLLRADILAQIGRYSVLYIGAPGDVKSPLPKAITAADIKFLKPFAEDKAKIAEWEKDNDNGRIGQPLYYDLSFNVDESTVAPAARVHYSRVIHVAEGTLEDDFYGKPRLRSCWNYLDDLDKVIGGGAEAAWKRMDPGMQVDIDPEMEIDEDAEDALSAEIDEYQHNLRRVIRTRGTKINLLASQVQGFGPNADAIIQLISATTGIPHRILTGSERGELASTQDRFNWSDRINERRRGFAAIRVRQLISQFILMGVLPYPATAAEGSPDVEQLPVTTTPEETIPGGYDIIWPDVGEVSNVQKAEVINKLAAANQAQRNAGLPPVITSDEIRHIVLDLGPLKPDQLPAPPVPSEPPPDDDTVTTTPPFAPADGASAGT
jgi:hypothetical protein